MSYRYAFLSEDSFDEVYETFVAAFSDYAVDMSYLTRERLYNRAVKNGVDLRASVGAFDGEKMVGFTLVGLDEWDGKPAAFDIGTGITAPHRGAGVANGMFEHALPRLEERGVEKLVLEVLQAVMRGSTDASMEIGPADRDYALAFEADADWRPSWENSFASIRRTPDDVRVYRARYRGEEAGMMAYYPALGWILSLVIRRPYRRRGIATALVENLKNDIRGQASGVKALNVPQDEAGMASCLRSLGFLLYVRQYEMELAL
jgi:GNAT superfamily N-acetyltransferase